MAFKDPKFNTDSSGGGGDDLPIGTFAYFPIASVTPNYITQGIYSSLSYPELSSVPGYTDVGADVDTINFSSSITYPFVSTQGVLALSNQNGTKMVFIDDDDQNHIIVDSDNITGLPTIIGNYFTPTLSLTDSNYIRMVENRHDGLTYFFNNGNLLRSLDVDLQLNSQSIDLNIFNGVSQTRSVPSSTSAVYGGNFFGFDLDNRFFCACINTTLDTIELLISNSGDYQNGQIITIATGVVGTPIDSLLGIGCSYDTSNNPVYWISFNEPNNEFSDQSIISYNKDGIGGIVDETLSFDPDLFPFVAVCGNKECNTIFLNRSSKTTTGSSYYQKVTQGSMIGILTLPFVDTVTFFAPIRGSNVGWVGVITTGTESDWFSFDDGDTWEQDVNSGGIASSCYSKAYGILGTGTTDNNDKVILNDDIVQFSSDQFLVPSLPALMGVTHEARHKALN